MGTVAHPHRQPRRGSRSITPELLYTGITDIDLRLRVSWLMGGAGAEFVDKQNSRRLELMARYYS